MNVQSVERSRNDEVRCWGSSVFFDDANFCCWRSDASQFRARVAPANVLSQMKSDGHSVHFQQIDIGPGQGQMFGHIYTVDKNYFLDLFRPAGEDKFKRLNSVNLGETPYSTQLDISFMWLQPKHYSGPILRLYDQDFPGEWDASDTLIVLPDGLRWAYRPTKFLDQNHRWHNHQSVV